MNLLSLFSKNPNIIINTDIDGILSGLLLVRYCGCKIIGFTNSKDKVWLADGFNDLYKSGVYIDIFVTHPEATCIDQHIVALDMQHMDIIRNNRNIFSPQSDDENNLRIFDSWGFENKYPFGTFQYLIAKLEAEGIKIELPNLDMQIPNSSILVGDLLNRPDDAMKTTLFAYERNAKNWWNWLENMSPNGGILKLRSYLEKIRLESINKVNKSMLSIGKNPRKKDYTNQLKKDVEEIKDKTRQYFSDNYLCRSSDGGFRNIVDENGIILDNIKSYINDIAKICELTNISLPRHYNTHVGMYYRTCWLDIFPRRIFEDYCINNNKIFSYAFIYSPGNDGQPNFSFTVNMK